MYRPTNTSKKSGGHITHVVLDFTQDTVGGKKILPWELHIPVSMVFSAVRYIMIPVNSVLLGVQIFGF